MGINQKQNNKNLLTRSGGALSRLQPPCSKIPYFFMNGHIRCRDRTPSDQRDSGKREKSSARKNNTFDNFVMFGRVEMIKERRYEWMWRRVVTEASSCVWQGNQHFYTWLRATFDVATRRNNDCEWERGVSKDDVRCEDIRWKWS